MKLISFLSAAAVLGLGVFTLGLTLGEHAIGLYSLFVGLLILLGIVRDYSPRRPHWQPRTDTVKPFSPPARAAQERLAA